MKIRNWNTDRLLAITALFVSLLAVVISYWQGNITQYHNRASVRPLVVMDGAIDESGSGWRIGNYGLGPAIVKWFKVSINSKYIYNWKDLQKELGLSGNYKFWNPTYKTVINNNDELEYLFWVLSEDDNKKLRNNKNKVSMDICYCDVYNECWEASTDLDRHPYIACSDPPKIQFHPHNPQ